MDRRERVQYEEKNTIGFIHKFSYGSRIKWHGLLFVKAEQEDTRE